MRYPNRHIIFWFLLLGTLGLVLFTGWGIIYPPTAVAAIRQLEETPGQMLYQSRQTLQDEQGNSWQAIAFQRLGVDGQTNFALRLVGLPGNVARHE